MRLRALLGLARSLLPASPAAVGAGHQRLGHWPRSRLRQRRRCPHPVPAALRRLSCLHSLGGRPALPPRCACDFCTTPCAPYALPAHVARCYAMDGMCPLCCTRFGLCCRPVRASLLPYLAWRGGAGSFGAFFEATTFFHLVHNLNENYEAPPAPTMCPTMCPSSTLRVPFECPILWHGLAAWQRSFIVQRTHAATRGGAIARRTAACRLRCTCCHAMAWCV